MDDQSSSEVSLPQHQLTYTIKILKEELHGHSICLESCVFLWIGAKGRNDFLLFGLGGETSSIVDGIPAPQNQVHLQAVCTKLSRVFKGRQVYFSTDIGGEAKDARYWLKFFESLKEHIDQNRNFYRLTI